jgi:hypothetical protein
MPVEWKGQVIRTLPKHADPVSGLTGQMGCTAVTLRPTLVAKKVRLVRAGRTGRLGGSPRQINVVLLTIAGVVFSGAASCQHGCGGCPAHGQRLNASDPEQSAEAAIPTAGAAGDPA